MLKFMIHGSKTNTSFENGDCGEFQGPFLIREPFTLRYNSLCDYLLNANQKIDVGDA